MSGSVWVQYYGLTREAAGCAGESVSVPAEGMDVASFLALVADRHGPALRRALLDENDRPLPMVGVLVDGVAVPPGAGERRVRPGSRVAIFYVMSGGDSK